MMVLGVYSSTVWEAGILKWVLFYRVALLGKLGVKDFVTGGRFFL